MFLMCCHLVFLTLTRIYTCTNSPSFPHLDSIKLYRDHPPLNTSYNREKPGTISGLQLELRRTPPARPSYAPTQHGVEEFTLI
ncbi:hypothetical protein JOQ06_004863, partial [Pogonophryne albipinna]